MVNAWTGGLLAGTAVAAVLTFLLALALRRRPRAVGLGALLVPVTALWLWAFGITAEVQQAQARFDLALADLTLQRTAGTFPAEKDRP